MDIQDHASNVNARSVPLAARITRILAKIRMQALRENNRVAKASVSTLETELADILKNALARTGADGANRLRLTGLPNFTASDLLDSSALGEAFDLADDRAAAIVAEMQERIDKEIRTILAEAQAQEVQPPESEIARTIQMRVRDLGGDIERNRAIRIARTETLIAVNTGIAAGLEVAGVERIEWLAFKSPVWPRRHDKMHGKTVKRGELFTLPSGAKARYPGDPSLPVGELANCRCGIRPARS